MQPAAHLEHILARVLGICVWVSAGLMATGLLLSLFHPMIVASHPPPLSIHTVIHDVLSSPFQPTNFLSLGLLVLMIAPVLRVCAALFGFAVARSRTYVVISSVVLILLIGEITYSLFIA
jgi:uncharacterized membrane protein